LRSIYLKKIFLSKYGESLIPVNLPADDPVRHAFSRSAIHMSDNQLRNYWNRRYFQGISPPYVLGSQEAVVRFVASTPGAIGYVNPCYLNPTVRQLLLLPAALSDEARPCPSQPVSCSQPNKPLQFVQTNFAHCNYLHTQHNPITSYFFHK